MSIESGAIFFLAIMLFAVTPGPGVFALLSKAMTQNARSCFPLAIGMAVSDVIYLVFACLGLASIAEHWSGLLTIIRFVGAAYLIYLGWRMWHSPANLMSREVKSSSSHQFAVFLQGILISASNPKVILFYIAFLPTFMDLTVLTKQDIVIASLLCFIGLMIGLMAVAMSADWAKNYFKSERASTALNKVAGSIMAMAGLYIGVRS